jgi:hypothetical protein
MLDSHSISILSSKKASDARRRRWFAWLDTSIIVFWNRSSFFSDA